MSTTKGRTPVHFRAALIAAVIFTAASSRYAAAQPTPPSAADFDQLLQHAQCIRENGYPEFPDPTMDGGRVRFGLEPRGPAAGLQEKFEAAQQACRDKLPSGLATLGQQNVSPEQLQALIGFAACVRASGVSDFPDPTPQGVFEITGVSFEMGSPQVRSALEACRESNPINGMMIRRK